MDAERSHARLGAGWYDVRDNGEFFEARWRCDRVYGNSDNEDRRRRRAFAKACCGHPNIFITLTSRYVEGGDPVAEERRLKLAWAKLRAKIRARRGNEDWADFVVVEETKRGWPHLHIVARGTFIPQPWLSAQWEALTGAPVVDIRIISSRKGRIRYIAKYLGKQSNQTNNRKRYWCTLNWCPEFRKYRTPPELAALPPKKIHASFEQMLTLGRGSDRVAVVATPRYMRFERPPPIQAALAAAA